MLSKIVFFGLVCGALSSPVPTSHTIHEARAEIPPQWLRGSRVRSDSILPVRIGLTQSNLDKAEEYIMAVSDPNSPTFGQHWTSAQVVEAFKPSDETIAKVKAWVHEHGFDHAVLSDNKAWIAFNAPAHMVERLLVTEFYEYTHLGTRDVVPSADRYHVPRSIAHHIDYITPGIKLLSFADKREKSVKKRESRLQRAHVQKFDVFDEFAREDAAAARNACKSNPTGEACLANCASNVTPQCIAALYSIPESTLTPNSSNKMGLYESEFQRWSRADLDAFYANYTYGRIPQGTYPENVAIDGGRSEATQKYPDPTHEGEIILDLDIAYPIVYPQEIAIWDENDLHYQSEIKDDTTIWGFNQLLDSIDGSYCTFSAYGETGDATFDPKYPNNATHGGYNHPLQCGVYKPPYVLSSSYGGQEANLPMAYQRRQCLEFMKIGLQGTSVFFASGDAGVGNYPQDSNYMPHTPTGCLGKNYTVFNPGWPVTCPWLTTVGATELIPGESVTEGQPEKSVFVPDPKDPAYNFTSGGGFSNLYPQPAYQKATVQGYLSKYPPSYPSYAQLAPNMPNPAQVDIDALVGDTGGLYNRIGRGYPDVSANGWNITVVEQGVMGNAGGTSAATPLFASIINRIVEERLAAGKGPLGFVNPTFYAHPEIFNDITIGSNIGCNTLGFITQPGWDPASGLGTPNYPAMLKLLMSLP